MHRLAASVAKGLNPAHTPKTDEQTAKAHKKLCTSFANFIAEELKMQDRGNAEKRGKWAEMAQEGCIAALRQQG